MNGSKHDKPARKATDLCRRITLSADAGRLLRDDLTPKAYVLLLHDHGLWVDALRVLAHALPNREAVWWTCLCTRLVVGATPPETEKAALQAAVHWVLKPTEEHRRAARQAADAAGPDSVAGRAARAAFFSNTKDPVRCARLVSATVLIAAAAGKAEKVSDYYRQFLALGRDVHLGSARWAPSHNSSARPGQRPGV